jgi:hypothetical protein
MRTMETLSALVSVCALFGCAAQSSTAPKEAASGGEDAGAGTAPTPAAGKAMVRIVHASTDAPNVDVYAKGSSTPIVGGIGYGQTSSWIEVDSGSVEVELRASPSTSTSPLLYTTGPLTIPDQSNVTAVAAGLVASSNSGDSFRVIPLVNGYGPAAPETARVRVLHAGADAPAVDLDLGNDNPAAPEVTALARFGDTGESGITLPAGQSIALGIDVGGARVTAFTTPSLSDGGDLLVIATGLLGSLARQSSGFALLLVGPNGNLGFVKQDPIVYALHASPDAPEVDAFVGEGKLIDGLSFGKLSAPIQVQPGAYPIDLFGHTPGSVRPAGEPVLSQSSGALAAGERYLAIATGFVAPPTGAKPLQLAVLREAFELGDARACLRAVHESPDAPAVDIGVVAGTSISPVLYAGLSFGDSSIEGGLEASPGQLPIGVATAGNDNRIVAQFRLTATAGQRAFVIAEGALSPPTGAQAFRLGVVDTVANPWAVTHVFPQ